MSPSADQPAAPPTAPSAAAPATTLPSTTLPSTAPAGPVRTAPVSGLQRGLWFLDRLNPQAATYTTPWTYDVDGPLDLGLLQRALDGVVARHEALRTTFALHPDGPRQHVHPALTVPLAVTDLRDLPEVERDARAAQLTQERAVEPFDLAAGPLLRAEAFRLADDRTTLLFVVHHIIWDGWSAEVFECELLEFHRALTEDRAPVLPELTTQYADWAEEEQYTSYEEHLAHWKQSLHGAPTLLELPGDRPRPAERSQRGATEPFGLVPGTAARVRELAEQEGVTPYTVQLAAFALLMGRWTGTDDLLVGTPVTTRNRPELADLLGYFVNLLPLRVRLSPQATFRALLADLQDGVFDAFGYLDVPFDQLVDLAGAARTLSTRRWCRWSSAPMPRTAHRSRSATPPPPVASAPTAPASSTSPGPSSRTPTAVNCAARPNTAATCSTPPPCAGSPPTTPGCWTPPSPTRTPPCSGSPPPGSRPAQPGRPPATACTTSSSEPPTRTPTGPP